MKKLLFLLSVSSVMILSSCIIGSVDSWSLDKEVQEQLLDEFASYVINEEYTGYVYRNHRFSCVNCINEDGVLESWGELIEDESETHVYMEDGNYIMVSSDNYMNQYFKDGQLYINVGETKSTFPTTAEDLDLQSRHLYVLGILETLMSEGGFEKYVKKVDGSEDFGGEIYLSFTFDMKQLNEDRILDDESEIYLKLIYMPQEDDWDQKVLYEVTFNVTHGETTESLSLIAPSMEGVIEHYLPDDLDTY